MGFEVALVVRVVLPAENRRDMLVVELQHAGVEQGDVVQVLRRGRRVLVHQLDPVPARVPAADEVVLALGVGDEPVVTAENVRHDLAGCELRQVLRIHVAVPAVFVP